MIGNAKTPCGSAFCYYTHHTLKLQQIVPLSV